MSKFTFNKKSNINKYFTYNNFYKNVQSSSTAVSSSKDTIKYRKRKDKIRKKLKAAKEKAKILSIPATFVTVLESSNTLSISVRPALESVVEFHNNLIENHHIIGGTKRFNEIRLYCIRLLEDSNPEPLERVSVGKKDRWPTVFDKLRPWFYAVRDNNCQESDRLIRSALYLNRLCSGNSQIDLSEITKKFEVNPEFRKRFKSFLRKRWSHIKMSGELITQPTLRVVSNGPNKKPKWQTADIEAYVLINSDYAPSFKKLCELTGNLDFYKYVEHQASLLTSADKCRIRYVTSFADKGNKSRVIAISDYWTQCLLKPIMDKVQIIIKENFGEISSSNDHNNGFQLLLKNIREGINCYDIKSWTDAHPSILQYDCMVEIFGLDIATAWYNLVVTCYWEVKGQKTPIKYGRGQGMGTNGSFDIATMTNLFILDMIFIEDYNIEMDTTYANEVGDDQWNYDPDLIIRDTFVRELGMEIQDSKVKSATKRNLCGEYVSRNINFGKDVSRISANICRAVKKNILDLPELCSHLAERRGERVLLNIRELFTAAGLKAQQHKFYIRTFYTLSLLFHSRPGMQLLRDSLISSFHEQIVKDEYILYICIPECLEVLRASYVTYSASKLLDSIVEKCEEINENARQFLDNQAVKDLGEPSKWWLNLDENIAVKTSKMALSQSYATQLRLYDSPKDADHSLEKLQQIEQSLTFKELGVIHSDKRPWRPTTSKLFNIVKSVEELTPSPDKVNVNSLIGIPINELRNSFVQQYSVSISYENRVMLPSSTRKYLGTQDIPLLSSTEDC